MSRVTRIRVEVEITEDDGEITVHEAEGIPRSGSTDARIVPHYRDQYSRRAGGLIASEIVDVAVRLDAVLRPGDSTLFRIIYPDRKIHAVEESVPSITD